QEAKLDGARFYGADLRGANLEKASFQGTRLEGVAIRYAQGLNQAQLNQACVDARTRLPDGLLAPPPCLR
ncbi:MAG: pentapeptide repeat-containing protein, partial [Nitrospirales bacterium]